MNPKGEYKGTNYSYSWNLDGWPASSMYSFANNDIYSALPPELQLGIIETRTVSGHGSTPGEENFVSDDKLYLLSAHELWEEGTSNQFSLYDTAWNSSRQLDYYKNLNVTTDNYDGARKEFGSSDSWWWLRSAGSNNINIFLEVGSKGGFAYGSGYYADGVSPAFRLG